MHIYALGSAHASAHECTQFGAYLLDLIDAGLDSTYVETTLLICEAVTTVSPRSTRADSHTCTWMYFTVDKKYTILHHAHPRDILTG